ncbi:MULTISPECIES: HNH endonuclease domain-containing protein [unclassified Streptomyces]|uniref:FDXHR family putative zinc-binding protein n=1 Tax=unclassified Streptomyces TaxID=2593676 RepID=UPI00278BEC08|nr:MULTISPECIES: HNH endonuclease domain-containing protein [unclassified Streptomyces]
MTDDLVDWRIPVYARGGGGAGERATPKPAAKKRIHAAQLGRCLYCQLQIGARVKRHGRVVALTAHWDHFIPFAYLAQNPDANWVLSCQVCNGIKSDRIFESVEAARAVILRGRTAKGFEAIEETRQRARPGRGRRKTKKAKKQSATREKTQQPARHVGRDRPARSLPPRAVSHGCGAWWTGNRRAHCPNCCFTFETDRTAALHRTENVGQRICLPPADAGLVPVVQPWGICWAKATSHLAAVQLGLETPAHEGESQ